MKDRSGFVRPLAICGFRRNGKILACLGKDFVKNEEYYRPLGGMIEFGERGEDALKREIMEEISEGIKNINLLGTLENIFIYNGKPHHEIVMVYDAEFENEKIYEMDEVIVNEAPGEDGTYVWDRAYWLEIDDCMAGKYILYPEGILDHYKT